MVMGLCKVASSVFFISDELLLCHAFKYTPCLNINNNLPMQALRGLIHINQFYFATPLHVIHCFKALLFVEDYFD